MVKLRITKILTPVVMACMMQSAMAIGQTPEQFGGIYYAYPEKEVAGAILPAAPSGYAPVYLSHYGRHGSRWPVNPKAYRIATEFLEREQREGNLTKEGEKTLEQIRQCVANAEGHLGELTFLGEEQHRGIARRMAQRLPELFADGHRIEARSSIQPRCIMSMAAATDGLRESSPRLDIRRHATPGDMEFIHHNTEAATLINSDAAPWRTGFEHQRDSLSLAKGMIAKLFKKYPGTGTKDAKSATDGQEQQYSLPAFVRAIYDIAISVQNIPGLDADLYSLFSKEELKNLWMSANYIQYVGNGNSPLSEAAGMRSAVPLLKEIIARADSMLAGGEVPVDLRFGHDTDLLRLVSLIGFEGFGAEASNPEAASAAWPNYEIAPMAGNLQLVFYRNRQGDVIFLPLLNERPVKIQGTPTIGQHFYPMSALLEIAEKY